MEILKRKIQAERQENQEEMSASITDGIRLSCRWHNKEQETEDATNLPRLVGDLKEKNDLLINFTAKETEKIKKIFRKGDC
jgi:hypothetical protein